MAHFGIVRQQDMRDMAAIAADMPPAGITTRAQTPETGLFAQRMLTSASAANGASDCVTSSNARTGQNNLQCRETRITFPLYRSQPAASPLFGGLWLWGRGRLGFGGRGDARYGQILAPTTQPLSAEWLALNAQEWDRSIPM